MARPKKIEREYGEKLAVPVVLAQLNKTGTVEATAPLVHVSVRTLRVFMKEHSIKRVQIAGYRQETEVTR